MSTNKPTSIDLILADTDAERIYLEKTLGVTQQEMAEFFYARFFAQGKVVSRSSNQSKQHRLDAVRTAIQQMKNATNKP
jgi:hypothetical protein